MKIKEKQWNLINEIALKIHSTEDLDEMRKDFLVYIKALFEFDRSVFYLQNKEDPYASPVYTNFTENDIDFYLNNFRNKDPFEPFMGIFLDSNSAIKSSDYSVITEVEETDYYKLVWEPKKIRFSLYVPLTYKEQWLGSVHFFRTESQGDFIDIEVEIINILKQHLQIRLYRELCAVIDSFVKIDNDMRESGPTADIAGLYSLTNRECDVINMWTKGYTDAEICEILYIAPNTLKKHISNIYSKTGIHNRIELFKLLQKE